MRGGSSGDVIVRSTQPGDFDGIMTISELVYPETRPWSRAQLQSHLRVFPEGQFVAVDQKTGKVVGMAASLIVDWDDYDFDSSWKDFTNGGFFTNHDAENGRTLYGAEVMVHPGMQGKGIGKKLYAARRRLVKEQQLLRIRAGARLRGYGPFKETMTPEQYVLKVIQGEVGDPTLSFQLKRGFRVLGVAHDYLHGDPDSCGHAAIIEWVNREVAHRRDTFGRDSRFSRPRKRRELPQAERSTRETSLPERGERQP